MAIVIDPIPRVFKLGDRELPDPNIHMTPEEVMAHYAPLYPELNTAIVGKEEHIGVGKNAKVVHHINKTAGTKG
jgi:PRTRC genetic system protein C